MTAHQELCARCDQPANRWSGAFTEDPEPWVGWCSNECKNAWLNGDKDAATERTVETSAPRAGRAKAAEGGSPQPGLATLGAPSASAEDSAGRTQYDKEDQG